MWPYFFSSMVESVPPPPSGLVIYSGGTGIPAPGSWGVTGGVLDYNGTTVSTEDAATITGLTVIEDGSFDGNLNVSELVVLETLGIQINPYNSVNFNSPSVQSISFDCASAIAIDFDCPSLLSLSIGPSFAEFITGITLTNVPVMEELQIGNTAITTLNLSNATSLINLTIASCGSLTTLNISNLNDLGNIQIVGCALTTLTATEHDSVTDLDLHDNSFLTTLTISDNFPFVQNVNLSNCILLTNFGTVPVGCTNLNCFNIPLEQTELDQVVADLANNNQIGGMADLRVQGAVTPTLSQGHVDGVWTLTVTGIPVGSFRLRDSDAGDTGNLVFGVDIDVSSGTPSGIAEEIANVLNGFGVFGWFATFVGGVVTVTDIEDSTYPLLPGTDAASNFSIANTSAGSRTYLLKLVDNSWALLTN